MPLREFECQDCHYAWEKLNPQGLQECPKCRSKHTTQRLSTFSWNFSPYFILLKEEGLD